MSSSTSTSAWCQGRRPQLPLGESWVMLSGVSDSPARGRVGFQGVKRCHGIDSWARGPLKPMNPLGADPLFSPNRIMFVRVWLLRCEVSSLYINRGRATCVRHHVFSQRLLPLVSFACQCGIEQGSIASAWFRATIIIVIVSNSTAMFSYPHRPWIQHMTIWSNFSSHWWSKTQNNLFFWQNTMRASKKITNNWDTDMPSTTF
jgi:hypothetical protein